MITKIHGRHAWDDHCTACGALGVVLCDAEGTVRFFEVRPRDGDPRSVAIRPHECPAGPSPDGRRAARDAARSLILDILERGARGDTNAATCDD